MKKMTTYLLVVLMIGALACPVTAQAAYNPPFSLQSKAAFLINLDTGLPIVEQNADLPLHPGYLTKVMTALVVLDYIKDAGKDLDRESATLKLYIQDLVYGSTTLANIYNGDELSIRDLLYAMMLQSANEATLMLADYVGDGSLGRFTELMNEKAAALGCQNTNFTDPVGYEDPDTRTTARDFAKIAAAAMAHPEFVEIVGAPIHEMTVLNKTGRTYSIYNYTNGLSYQGGDYYLSTASGIMSSNLAYSGKCMVSQASSGGYTYLAVVLGAPLTNPDGTATDPVQLHYHEVRELFRWAFNSFSVRTVLEKGELVEQCKVKYAVGKDFVNLETGARYAALMESSMEVSSIQYVFDIPDFITAPVEKGQQVGTLRMMLAEEEIGSVPLLAAESLSASGLLKIGGWFSNLMHTFWAKFAIILLLVLLLGYAFLFVHVNNKRRTKSGSQGRRGGNGRFL